MISMTKLSLALAAAGLLLLLASAWPAPALPATARPPSAPTAAPRDAVADGRALFRAKGCVACHHHAGVPGSGAFGEGNPDLSTVRLTDEYLQSWLSDPAAVRPGTAMPNLDLAPDEITGLIAFLKASDK